MLGYLRPLAFSLCVALAVPSGSLAQGGTVNPFLDPANAPNRNVPPVPVPALPDRAQGAPSIAAPPVNSVNPRPSSGRVGMGMSRRGYSRLRGRYAEEAVRSNDRLLDSKLKSICRGC